MTFAVNKYRPNITTNNILNYYGLVTPYGDTQYALVNIDSGNGLLPDGTKPLPEPMLTNHKLGYCGIHLRVVLREMLKISFLKCVWKLSI